MVIIFLVIYLAWALSEVKSSNIFIKAEDSFSKTPSATDWQINNNNNNKVDR